MRSTATRRQLIKSFAAGFAGLRVACDPAYAARVFDTPVSGEPAGYGPLIPDPNGLLDLPAGFTYHAFSRTGDRMSDGRTVPGAHDGMGAFAGPNGTTILVRNHELEQGPPTAGPFDGAQDGFETIPRGLFYDYGSGTHPAPGGTVTLVYDTAGRRLVQSSLSLIGTMRNCAGGQTPWGTWITCEESVVTAGEQLERNHGYCFEVPATTEMRVHAPVRLTEMGRFYHEAVAVDRRTGIVYLTEDRHDSLLYRFLPVEPGNLSAGGRLQALAVRERHCADTRNYAPGTFPRATKLKCRWIDLEDVKSPNDDLRAQGFAKGAAQFSRGEGIWATPDGIFFACTEGGAEHGGQIFRYVPGASEGGAGEDSVAGCGALELWIEANNSSVMQNADNIMVRPSGEAILCEDGPGPNRLLGVTSAGETFCFGRNVFNNSEMAGLCQSADGSTVFVNLYSPGLTFAITGPWKAQA